MEKRDPVEARSEPPSIAAGSGGGSSAGCSHRGYWLGGYLICQKRTLNLSLFPSECLEHFVKKILCNVVVLNCELSDQWYR